MPKRAREEDDDLSAVEAPTSINPYSVLSLDSDASQDEVKKAYKRAALKHHPDKATSEDKHAAHIRFQEIALAYAVLSDEKRRRRYDTTGSTEESITGVGEDDDDFDWTTFYKTQYAESVTAEKIRAFAKEYKGSEEEARDVLAAYTKFKGAMGKLYQSVMLSDMTEDEESFRSIIDKAIESGDVEAYDKYTKEKESTRQKRIAQARKIKEREAPEAEEAEEEIKEKAAKRESKKGKKGGGGDIGDLAAMIQSRQKAREASSNGFFANLEARYAPKGKKGKKAATMEEPPEEAFAKNRAKKQDGADDAVEGARKSKRAKR